VNLGLRNCVDTETYKLFLINLFGASDLINDLGVTWNTEVEPQQKLEQRHWHRIVATFVFNEHSRRGSDISKHGGYY